MLHQIDFFEATIRMICLNFAPLAKDFPPYFTSKEKIVIPPMQVTRWGEQKSWELTKEKKSIFANIISQNTAMRIIV